MSWIIITGQRTLSYQLTNNNHLGHFRIKEMFTPYLYILGDLRDLKTIMIFYMQVCKVKDSKRTHMSTFAYHALLTKVVESQMEIVNNHHFFS